MRPYAVCCCLIAENFSGMCQLSRWKNLNLGTQVPVPNFVFLPKHYCTWPENILIVNIAEFLILLLSLYRTPILSRNNLVSLEICKSIINSKIVKRIILATFFLSKDIKISKIQFFFMRQRNPSGSQQPCAVEKNLYGLLARLDGLDSRLLGPIKKSYTCLYGCSKAC